MSFKHYTSLLFYLFLLSGCYEETTITIGEGLEDWTTGSHSAQAIPNYDIVFPQNSVNKFTITISSQDWASMQSNLNSIFGSSAGGPGGDFPDETPNYYPCTLEFNDIQWYHVGIRYKGNSSLQASSRGETKLPFRFQFDKFEDEYPEITGQTFYGFPALSMSSNYNDLSLMRERTANYLFTESAIPAPSAAFYEMYVDYGVGPIYFGLYTGVEVVFETMLTNRFGSDTGNCYKPEDDGATFANFGFNLADFENKTTGGTGLDDIQEMYEALHNIDRITDLEEWKNSFESIFDVQGFLKWLAVNTTIQNWDTYGNMAHNYYLYHDPQDDLIKWIPWDNNEAFEFGKQGGALSIDLSDLNGSSWPLIDLLIDIDEYEQDYKNYIIEFIEGPFEASKMHLFYDDLMSIINTSVANESTYYSFLNSYSDFTSAIATLKSHVTSRNSIAGAYAY